MKNALILLIVITLFSCKAEKYKIEKYENGNIKKRYILQDGKQNGICYEYYETGDLKYVNTWKSGKKVDEQLGFYFDGKIKEKSSFKNGLYDGPRVIYDEDGNIIEKGNFEDGLKFGYFSKYHKNYLYQMVQYIIVDSTSIINQYWNFDESGNLIRNMSNYYSLKVETDSISVNKEIEIEIYLPSPFYGKGQTEINIGAFDYNFHLIDSTNYKVFPVFELKATIPIKFDQKGEQFLRGLIKNYQYIDSTQSEMEFRIQYFEKLFFVY